MSKFSDSLSAFNSFVRTLLALVVVGGIGYGGWYGYSSYADRKNAEAENLARLQETQQDLQQTRLQLDDAQKEIQVKLREIDSLKQDVERLDTSLRLLKVNRRLARLTVVDQGPDQDSGELYTTVEFVEVNEEGQTIGQPKQFRIKGDTVFIDHWLVKFEDKYIEQADVDRSTSLVLFRRIFGEHQNPNDGFPLDEVGSRPQAYARGGEMTELEKKIWGDFWNIATNPQLAEELGIRAAHGDAPYVRVKNGMIFKVLLRASDGVTITPEVPAPPREPST
jgi:hypothetical protein